MVDKIEEKIKDARGKDKRCKGKDKRCKGKR